MTAAAAASPSPSPVAAAGRYLTFRLDGDEFGLPILQVRELLGRMPMTRLPGASANVLGVANLRGKVLTITDLRGLMGLPRAQASEYDVVVVLDVKGARNGSVGVLVDEVLDVVSVSDAQLEAPPAEARGPERVMLRGVARLERRLVLLIDPSESLGLESAHV